MPSKSMSVVPKFVNAHCFCEFVENARPCGKVKRASNGAAMVNEVLEITFVIKIAQAKGITIFSFVTHRKYDVLEGINPKCKYL